MKKNTDLKKFGFSVKILYDKRQRHIISLRLRFFELNKLSSGSKQIRNSARDMNIEYSKDWEESSTFANFGPIGLSRQY